MSETPTPNIALEKPTPGTEIGTWGPIVNSNYDILDGYIGGTTPTPFNIPFTGNPSFSGNPTFSGNPNFSGNPTFSNPLALVARSLNTATVFADAMAGADAAAKIQAAITLLPGAGGTVNAINLTDVGGTGSVNIDPGTKTVRLLLGPNTYHISQIICRTGFQLIGCGSGNGVTGQPPTLLQAMGSDATSPIIIGQDNPHADIRLSGFRLLGAAGNTSQNGIDFQAPTGGGLWYSELDDIQITLFMGISLNLVASTASSGGINQFSNFRRIVVYRPSGSSYALQIKGYNNSLKFENCEFDCTPFIAGGDGLTNVFISDDSGGVFPPYNIKFDLVTCQFTGVGFLIQGCDCVSIDQGHFEGVFGAIQTGAGASFGSLNVTIHDTGFFNGTGVNGGNGFIINQTAATGNASICCIDSHAYTVPDIFMKGNTGSIICYGNTIGPEGSYTQQAIQPGGPNGFGTGAAGTAVTTTTKGGGTGPTTPQTVVKYVEITLSGTAFWVPLMQ